MKYIGKFSVKTIEETAKSIDKTQIKLKLNLNKDYYDASHNTIQINKKATKKTLKECKFKKYNYLKHNPKPAIKATDLQEDNENWVQPSYAQVTACPSLKRPSLTNTNSKPNNKNIHEKLRSSQVHLIASANREFHQYGNHQKQMK